MKTKTSLVVIVLLILGSLIYWFEARPYITRKGCEAFAGSKGSSKIAINNLYRQCLVQHGMQPESLYVNLE